MQLSIATHVLDLLVQGGHAVLDSTSLSVAVSVLERGDLPASEAKLTSERLVAHVGFERLTKGARRAWPTRPRG